MRIILADTRYIWSDREESETRSFIHKYKNTQTRKHTNTTVYFLRFKKSRSMRIILVDTRYIWSDREESETRGDAARKRELRNSCLGGG